MEAEKTKFYIVQERQRVLEQEAETQRKQNIIKAQTEAEVTKIRLEKELGEQESRLKIQQIENEIYLATEKARTDAEFCKYCGLIDFLDKIMKEIEANNKKLTPEYLKFVSITSLTNNTKLYFGENLPKYFNSNILEQK